MKAEHGAEGRRWRPPDEPCLNCGDPTPGRFCPACGQRKTVVQVSVGTIIGDVVRDELALNASLPRTLGGLLFRPGHITREYIRGRVVRYIPPLRLYLISSILFFIALSFLGLGALDRVTAWQPDAIEHPDAVRELLLERRAELEARDTVELSTAQRAMLLQVRAYTETALAALSDTAVAVDPARLAELVRLATTDVTLPRGSLQPWAIQLRDGTQGWLRPVADRRLAQVGHLPWRDALRQVLADLLDYAPHMVFLLLPVFALLLKLLYIRRGRYYAEHFVFALHVHAFFFLMFFIMLVLPWSKADWLLILWMLAYVWLAMKRVYGQGWFRTTVKWWVLGWSYVFVLTFGMLALSMGALLVL